MTPPPPIPCVWTGSAFEPTGNFRRVADKHFGEGEVVTLVAHEERSSASHRHFFAAVNEAWKSLPEHLAAEFPTSEHLRKVALIKAGFRDERSIVCASAAEARRVAAFVKPMDDFALVSVAGAAVVVLTAKSQSVKAMGARVFQESKEAVLTVLAEMIDVTPAALEQAGMAA
jgi:hypothetical protein